MSRAADRESKNWLPHFIEAAGTNMNRLAKALDTDRQTIYRLAKRIGSVPKGWADQIAPVLGTSPIELMYGPGSTAVPDADLDERPVTQAPVVGVVAAGMWLEDGYMDGVEFDPIPIVLAKYPDLAQKAYKVQGASMDLVRIFDGDYVITVPYWEARARFQDNDIVVVERRDGHRIERTCKQVAVHKDHVELWPRSSCERFREPLIVSKNGEPNDGIEVEIVGLVIGRHTVM